MNYILRFTLIFAFMLSMCLPAYAKPWTTDNMMLVNNVQHPSVSPDGKLVAYTITKHIHTDIGKFQKYIFHNRLLCT